MKFKVFMATLLTLTFLATSFNTYQIFQMNGGTIATAPANKKPSTYKFGVKYEKAVEQEKPMALLFYADWCRFCIAFMPKYQKLYKKYKRKYNFVKINVEDPQYRDQVIKYQIEGFPTLFLVNPKDDSHIRVENSNFDSEDKMKEIFDSFLENGTPAEQVTEEIKENEQTETKEQTEEKK